MKKIIILSVLVLIGLLCKFSTAKASSLTCYYPTQTVLVGQKIGFFAYDSDKIGASGQGASKNYIWSALEGNPVSAIGSNFVTEFNTPGIYTITVTDGKHNGSTGFCYVIVK